MEYFNRITHVSIISKNTGELFSWGINDTLRRETETIITNEILDGTDND